MQTLQRKLEAFEREVAAMGTKVSLLYTHCFHCMMDGYCVTLPLSLTPSSVIFSSVCLAASLSVVGAGFEQRVPPAVVCLPGGKCPCRLSQHGEGPSSLGVLASSHRRKEEETKGLS